MSQNNTGNTKSKEVIEEVVLPNELQANPVFKVVNELLQALTYGQTKNTKKQIASWLDREIQRGINEKSFGNSFFPSSIGFPDAVIGDTGMIPNASSILNTEDVDALLYDFGTGCPLESKTSRILLAKFFSGSERRKPDLWRDLSVLSIANLAVRAVLERKDGSATYQQSFCLLNYATIMAILDLELAKEGSETRLAMVDYLPNHDKIIFYVKSFRECVTAMQYGIPPLQTELKIVSNALDEAEVQGGILRAIVESYGYEALLLLPLQIAEFLDIVMPSSVVIPDCKDFGVAAEKLKALSNDEAIRYEQEADYLMLMRALVASLIMQEKGKLVKIGWLKDVAMQKNLVTKTAFMVSFYNEAAESKKRKMDAIDGSDTIMSAHDGLDQDAHAEEAVSGCGGTTGSA